MGLLFLCLFVNRTGSLEQVTATSALHIKGIPTDLVVLKLNVGIEDSATADALVRRTDRTQVGSLDGW